VANKVIALRKQGYNFGQISEMISQQAVEYGCKDNITLVIIDLQAYY
jgi:serine/threonine protein phosphatase PrpC